MVLKIDNVWPLEGFVTQLNAEPGLNIGLIGTGQGGGKMVDAMASIRSPKNDQPIYPAMVINSNLGDMKNLKNIPAKYKFPLLGYEKGVGKDPETGRQAFLENGERIFDAIAELMQDVDVVVVAASMGGGTGTGSINELTDAISRFLGKPVIAITSLPRPNEVESLNAYNALAELVPKLNHIETDDNGRSFRLLESLIMLDNEKIIQDHIQEPEVPGISWDYYSNYKLASTLHEWSVLTSLGSDYTVDAADLYNHILFGGGVITFAKKRINLDEVTNKDDLIQEIISTYRGKNVLANGFDYVNDMRSMALVVVIPREREHELNHDTLEIIRTEIKNELPQINFYPGLATHGSKRHAIVYTIANMAGLPERAKNLREEAEALQREREERENRSSGFNLGEKIQTSNRVGGKRGAAGINPYKMQVAASSEETKEPNKIINPFKK
ncbi:cell division GTPase [Paenibacillus campinasensis]|uniref:Cell division GTPase n=1 Tax=Paenibacillus campinasensis TaxID=66347 RepID=A0A268EE13_9BACL|nr:cell division GTPase [Paenibacillus campinasensis]PAD71357.1 cell division GTPase [Paenibacillus campinasensis]